MLSSAHFQKIKIKAIFLKFLGKLFVFSAHFFSIKIKLLTFVTPKPFKKDQNKGGFFRRELFTLGGTSFYLLRQPLTFTKNQPQPHFTNQEKTLLSKLRQQTPTPTL